MGLATLLLLQVARQGELPPFQLLFVAACPTTCAVPCAPPGNHWGQRTARRAISRRELSHLACARPS